MPGCQAVVEAATHSSKFCTKNRPSEPILSRLKRQWSPIAQLIDLRREIPTVNARMPNGRSAQTARQGETRAGAGSPGTIGRHGSRRQTSNHRNQTSVIIDRPLEGARAAIWAAPSPGCDQEIVKFKNHPPNTLPHSTHSTTLYDPEHRFCRVPLYS